MRMRWIGACCALALGLAAALAVAANASRLGAASDERAAQAATAPGPASRLALRRAQLRALDRRYLALARGTVACAAGHGARVKATRLRRRALAGLGHARPAGLSRRLALMHQALGHLGHARSTCAMTATPAPGSPAPGSVPTPGAEGAPPPLPSNPGAPTPPNAPPPGTTPPPPPPSLPSSIDVNADANGQ